jgi:uncharacterized protein YecT (DUF1311 family)
MTLDIFLQMFSRQPRNNRGSMVVFLIFTLCISPFANAHDDWDFAKPHKNRCSRADQQEMNSCMADEYRKVEGRLNTLFNQLLVILRDKNSLKESQTAWLRFRDMTCAYANSGIEKEGSLYSFAQNACHIDITEKRIRDFEQYLAWNCNGCPPRK